MMLSIKAGATSQSINVFVRDSTSTTGGGLAAVAPAGGSLLTGTKLYYSFTGTNASAGVAVSLAVLAAVNSAWSSAGIVTLDGTNMIGWVRIDVPDAALAASKGRVVSFLLFGGTNMAPTPFSIELTGWDNQDAVHGGMSALPNTPCTGNASLITSGSGTDQLLVASGKVVTPDTQKVDVNTIKTQTVTCAAGVTVNVNVGTTQPVNFTGTGASALVKGDTIDWNSVAVTGMPMPTYTQPTGFLAATFPSGTIASTTNITAGTIATVTNLTNAPTAGDLTATMKTSVQTACDAAVTANATVIEIGADVDELIVSVAAIPTSNPSAAAISTQVGSDLSTAHGAGSWATATGFSVPGDTMTMDQTKTVAMVDVTADVTLTVGKALLAARAQGAGAWAIVGTSLVLKNPDGSTFRTFTLDSAVSPTSRT